MSRRRQSLTVGLTALYLASALGCTQRGIPGNPPAEHLESAAIGRIRELSARVPATLSRNHKTLVVPDGTVDGFGAGEAYPQIWLRDSAWLVSAAAAYYDENVLTSWLDLHLSVAESTGRLRDWVAMAPPDTFREWAPRVIAVGPFAVDKNTNESDQEPSAALAYCRVVESLYGQHQISGPRHKARVGRLIRAMDALLRDRFDTKTGLVWSGLTADWGDVSPVYPDQRAIYLDALTPRTFSLYSNVMTVAALDCLASLAAPGAQAVRLRARAETLRSRIRARFWRQDRGFFRVRLLLDRLPPGFDDDEGRFALGGNALAALFGVADDGQAASIFEGAERLRVANGFSTISTTLIPPYAAGVFQHPAMREPFQYQNGGQWDWFGALLVHAEFERGHSHQALKHLDQIATRILKAGPGIHEWYGQDGAPRGSAAYAAAAATLHNAIMKGLFGLSRSPAGYRVVIRTTETFAAFDLPLAAASGRLVVSQEADGTHIDVTVGGAFPVGEVCTLLPPGSQALDRPLPGAPQTRTIPTQGKDTLMCADVSTASRPIRVRFTVEKRVLGAAR